MEGKETVVMRGKKKKRNGDGKICAGRERNAEGMGEKRRVEGKKVGREEKWDGNESG